MRYQLSPLKDPDAHKRLYGMIEDPVLTCDEARSALSALVDVTNRETTMLQSGRLLEAGELSAEKTRLAEDFVRVARKVQHNAADIAKAAPEAFDKLRKGHEALVTQLSENLKVLASARNLTENLISDVARRVGKAGGPSNYAANGGTPAGLNKPANGLSLDRAT